MAKMLNRDMLLLAAFIVPFNTKFSSYTKVMHLLGQTEEHKFR